MARQPPKDNYQTGHTNITTYSAKIRWAVCELKTHYYKKAIEYWKNNSLVGSKTFLFQPYLCPWTTSSNIAKNTIPIECSQLYSCVFVPLLATKAQKRA